MYISTQRPLCTGPNYAQGPHSVQSAGRVLIRFLTGQVALDLSIVWRGGLGADCPSTDPIPAVRRKKCAAGADPTRCWC